ncbi:MAG: NAD-dependent protein deacylase [Erysipelotrichaceae bacterium]|jgi:NAD-dependent deacetylase|nr:NAD-dependent protein deacylase [Erysipelotrichaceae bacterium]
MNDEIQKLAQYIDTHKRLVFFGGAGVSTESGIPDFRGEAGLYKAKKEYGYPPEELISHTFFIERPALFFRYYRENLLAFDAKPNGAHIALAKLEEAGKLGALITQNIDDLHRQAGSKNVLELHGTNARHYCVDCKKSYSLQYTLDPKNQKDGIPRCESCGGVVRPDVVLYEEALDSNTLTKAVNELAKADLCIVGGTSLAVYPAAGLLRYFTGNTLVLINKTPTAMDSAADLIIREPIGEVLSEAVKLWEEQNY